MAIWVTLKKNKSLSCASESYFFQNSVSSYPPSPFSMASQIATITVAFSKHFLLHDPMFEQNPQIKTCPYAHGCVYTECPQYARPKTRRGEGGKAVQATVLPSPLSLKGMKYKSVPLCEINNWKPCRAFGFLEKNQGSAHSAKPHSIPFIEETVLVGIDQI